MSTLPPQLRIANTAAVLNGAYGTVTRQADACGLSRPALYRDAPKVVQAVEGSDSRDRLQALEDEIDRLRTAYATLRSQRLQAVLIDARRHAGRQVAPVIPIGALARYDRPAPALDAYDQLLTRTIP